MYQPGFDQGLAQIRYAEVLEEAAIKRAQRAARNAQPAPKPAARRLALALAAAAPIVVWIGWIWVAH